MRPPRCKHHQTFSTPKEYLTQPMQCQMRQVPLMILLALADDIVGKRFRCSELTRAAAQHARYYTWGAEMGPSRVDVWAGRVADGMIRRASALPQTRKKLESGRWVWDWDDSIPWGTA